MESCYTHLHSSIPHLFEQATSPPPLSRLGARIDAAPVGVLIRMQPTFDHPIQQSQSFYPPELPAQAEVRGPRDRAFGLGLSPLRSQDILG